MNPRDFHRLAEQLANRTTPAEFRTAIGRAYYAAFNVAAEGLRAVGTPLGKGAAAHGEAPHFLRNSGHADLARAATVLEFLHRVRNRADYQLDKADVETRQAAAGAVADARKAIDAIDTALTGPERASIQAAIAKWRRENGYP